jgi:hypothetical protein
MGNNEEEKPVIEFSAMEIYRELIREKKGEAAADAEAKKKRERMKKFLKDTMKTD